MPQIIRQLFEEEFARRLGVSEAVAVNSGTSALVAALASIELKPGDEVITTPFTFASTANAIVLAGGTPVFVDVGSDNLIDAELITRSITQKTKAIVPVHLFGRSCNMDLITQIAKEYDLIVIEDCAQSLGAKYKDRHLGTIGDIGCFSFYKTKNLSCFEGGMVIGGDIKKIRNLVDPISNKLAGWPVIGYNFRMPEPCCLIGYEKIKLHWEQILFELGRYSEKDGYYPDVIYDMPCYSHRNLSGSCPNAEKAAKNAKMSHNRLR